MTQPKHTPLPWELNKRGPHIIQVWKDGGFRTVAACGVSTSLDADHEANAAFIVRACNSFYLMFDALESILNSENIEEIKANANKVLQQVQK